MRMSIIAVLLLSGCATARVPARVAVDSGRVRDSVSEKQAAQRANDPHQRAEAEEERWGIEQSKERKEAQRQRAAQKAETRPGADVSKSKADAKKK